MPAEATFSVLFALMIFNPIACVITVLVCRWYTLKAREVLKQVETLVDEEVSHG